MTTAPVPRVLVADDEAGIRQSLQEIIIEEGYEALAATNGAEVFAAAGTGIDLALIDIKLGSDDGIEVLRKLREQFPAVPVVMITGFGTVALASQAFKLGAHEFLEKPLRLMQVRTCIRNTLEGVRLRRTLTTARGGSCAGAVYCSDAMKTLYRQAAKLAMVREPVMIFGESGSGKELMARYLHFEGARAAGPFIVTNAPSMPVTLAEDELFGHEKGAFTGADRRRIGSLEQANGGSLFLDEIGDLDPQIQAKLLRVLEQGEFSRLGSNTPQRTDVRLICATHKNLEDLVRTGAFRHDLWFRINTFILHVPPLEQRKDDIPLLARHFLAAMCAELGVNKEFTPEALEAVSRMSFPGNVRELKHVVARLAVYSEGAQIALADVNANHGVTPGRDATALSAVQGEDYSTMDFRDARMAFEINYLKVTLARNDGNITATARDIGMAQSNLSRKLKELGIRD